ncbi:cobalamin-binding protein [Alteromonas facilis]|uniref:cobalamin-binding protein n=1 Tax=Alteromonas facilis TaxID=2048004 RepID=UPI000C284E9B|nr:cobalamin-binding protein [Alteromonas facilis]
MRNLVRTALVISLFALQNVAIASNETNMRIVTLSPHLTEWVYLLKAERSLVGVSAFSNYPEAAETLPVIVDVNGINFTQLLALKPTLILAWEGGNKPQDISRLRLMNIPIFNSSPKTLEDIAEELLALGKLIKRSNQADVIVGNYRTQLQKLRQQFQRRAKVKGFYYLWHKPLMTIGANAWANQILNVCNIDNIFADAPVDYPEVRMAEVISRQPDILITSVVGAQSSHIPFWQTHKTLLDATLIELDPDIAHRFSPRILTEIQRLCSLSHGQ